MLDVVVEDVTHYLCPQDVARGGSTHQLARDVRVREREWGGEGEAFLDT